MFAWRRGRVVRQRPAKPRTAVRVRSSPLVPLLLALVVAGCAAGSEQVLPPGIPEAEQFVAQLSDLPTGFNLNLAESFPVPTSTILADPWSGKLGGNCQARARLRLPGVVHEPAGCPPPVQRSGLSVEYGRSQGLSVADDRRRLDRRRVGRTFSTVAEIGDETVPIGSTSAPRST